MDVAATSNRATITIIYNYRRNKFHSDKGGDPVDYTRIQEAYELLMLPHDGGQAGHMGKGRK